MDCGCWVLKTADFFLVTGYKLCHSKSLPPFDGGLFSFSHSSENTVEESMSQDLLRRICTECECGRSVIGSLTNSEDSGVIS